ncbi:MAG TPA: hypothetical protein VME46_19890, partial [Acidimicrobiales bacterium]|nr:hypothetical protein [Acidimicrobiales bacterium]
NVEIIVKQVNNVLVVPTSAIHTVGTLSYVYVLKNGKEVETRVTLGASGDAETQITSGLSVGAVVVIASLRATVPSGTSSPFGFPGGGGGGGRFTRVGGSGGAVVFGG